MNNPPRIKKSRVWEIDFFRGFAILLVIWDHAMVALAMFHSSWKVLGTEWLINWGVFGIEYLDSYTRFFWRPVFLFIFFFTSGISTAFSKNNLIRGLKLLGVSIGVSVFTYIFSYLTGDDYFILFGVLHCIAIIILIYTAVVFIIKGIFKIVSHLTKRQSSKKMYKTVTAAVCILLSVIFYWIHKKYNISLYETDVSKMFLDTDSKWLGMFLYVSNWATADYFPLFPFISFFFLGAGLSQFLYPERKSLLPSLDGKWNRLFTVSGRYSLLIYLSIQVVVFALLALITFLATGEFLL